MASLFDLFEAIYRKILLLTLPPLMQSFIKEFRPILQTSCPDSIHATCWLEKFLGEMMLKMNTYILNLGLSSVQVGFGGAKGLDYGTGHQEAMVMKTLPTTRIVGLCQGKHHSEISILWCLICPT